MADLRSLFNKISSVQSTKKITSVMKMVATARLVTGKESLRNVTEYFSTTQNILANCDDNLISYIKNKICDNTQDYLLLIIISSSKGLCAGYNNTVNTKLIEYLKICTNKKVDLFFVGKKCHDLYHTRAQNIKFQPQIRVLEVSNESSCEKIFHSLQEYFLKSRYSECKVIFSKMKNGFTFITQTEDLFSIEKTGKTQNLIYEFEQNRISVITALFNQFLYAKFSFMYFCAFVSENVTRMLSMDSATNNAQKISDELKLQYNKLRQDKITREIIEIIGGANAI